MPGMIYIACQPPLEGDLVPSRGIHGGMPGTVGKLDGRTQKPAPLPASLLGLLGEPQEHPFDAVRQCPLRSGPALVALKCRYVAGLQIRRHEFVLGREVIVQRLLSDPGLFCDPVHADLAKAACIEQGVGGADDLVSRGHGVRVSAQGPSGKRAASRGPGAADRTNAGPQCPIYSNTKSPSAPHALQFSCAIDSMVLLPASASTGKSESAIATNLSPQTRQAPTNG